MCVDWYVFNFIRLFSAFTLYAKAMIAVFTLMTLFAKRKACFNKVGRVAFGAVHRVGLRLGLRVYFKVWMVCL